MDPQQRHLLELGYEAFHGAGLPRAQLSGSNTSIYVGIMSMEFKDALQLTNTYAFTGLGHCFAAGRLSYVLGLHGECEAIDTACSASLVACHHARSTMVLRDCPNSLFAGVNMMFLPSTTAAYSAAGITSRSGRSFAFDARADGFIRGEGCCAYVLGQGVECFEALAELAGTAVRQDGRSASLTAPNGRAQQLLLNATLADARMQHAR